MTTDPIIISLVVIVYGAVLFFALWKFYDVLARINANLAGIKQALIDKKAPGA